MCRKIKCSKFPSSTQIPNRETFAPLVNCVTDDTPLKTKPNIDAALLQFTDVIKLLDMLLH